MSWISPGAGGVLLSIRVVPRASKNEVTGEHAGALKIRLRAPPVEGKANKALVDFLSETLSVSRSAITLVSGETGRNKRVAVAGVTEGAIRRALTR